MESEGELGSALRAIDSTNVGFKLLKKCGWKEGTGLGVSEQGRLEPLEPQVKNNMSGIGAEKVKRKMKQLSEDRSSEPSNRKDPLQPKMKTKLASKRLRKMLEEEERMKERAFQQAFFREFWPDNV